MLKYSRIHPKRILNHLRKYLHEKRQYKQKPTGNFNQKMSILRLHLLRTSYRQKKHLHFFVVAPKLNLRSLAHHHTKSVVHQKN